jgi:multidrug efflux pump subunit AcrA (membrane-fusion protein)
MAQALKHDARPDPNSPERLLEPGELQARQPRRRRWLARLSVALCVAAIVKFAAPAAPVPLTIPTATIKRQAVTALGWLEPASNIIKLAAPATVEASRIASLEVKEGDPVEEGQVVAGRIMRTALANDGGAR